MTHITPCRSQGVSNQLAGKAAEIIGFGTACRILMTIIGILMTSRERGGLIHLLWHAKNRINFSGIIFILLDQVAEDNYIEFIEEEADKIDKNTT